MPPSDLYDSLCERLEGRRYSNYFACYCIFDQHTTPALLVFEDGMYKCLSCGRIGNHKQLDRKIGSHFRAQKNNTVSRVLPQWRKWEEKYDDLAGIVYYAHQSLLRHEQFQTYLKRRKIYEFTREGNLGYLDGYIVFPVTDGEGRLVDLVVRSTRSEGSVRYVVHPGVDGLRPIYVPSWKKINESSTVYVVYGIIDSISLYLAGLPTVTGVTGKSLSPELLLPLHKRFIIVPDDGEDREAHKLANQLGWKARVKKIDYSQFEDEKIKDPDSIRCNFGNQTLLQALA